MKTATQGSNSALKKSDSRTGSQVRFQPLAIQQEGEGHKSSGLLSKISSEMESQDYLNAQSQNLNDFCAGLPSKA